MPALIGYPYRRSFSGAQDDIGNTFAGKPWKVPLRNPRPATVCRKSVEGLSIIGCDMQHNACRILLSTLVLGREVLLRLCVLRGAWGLWISFGEMGWIYFE